MIPLTSNYDAHSVKKRKLIGKVYKLESIFVTDLFHVPVYELTVLITIKTDNLLLQRNLFVSTGEQTKKESQLRDDKARSK